ncbi:MAG: AMP-binding protein, partial [Magnetospirillum sp.]|nr:AMP-binding protein [Magnetospirillum sp.]
DLRIMTQAGGKLDLAVQEAAHAAMVMRGGKFFVMYGQTEAAPRMTTLPHDLFGAKKGSVGPALPGGSIAIWDEFGTPCPPGTEGEVVYGGPNVMMGYVQSRADLAQPDRMGGILHTGDMGWLDEDGCLYLSGRRDRVGKIHGWRVNLDEIEDSARQVLETPVAVLLRGDSIVLAHEGAPRDPAPVRLALADRFALPGHVYALAAIPALPRSERGKLDYTRLEAMLP